MFVFGKPVKVSLCMEGLPPPCVSPCGRLSLFRSFGEGLYQAGHRVGCRFQSAQNILERRLEQSNDFADKFGLGFDLNQSVEAFIAQVERLFNVCAFQFGHFAPLAELFDYRGRRFVHLLSQARYSSP